MGRRILKLHVFIITEFHVFLGFLVDHEARINISTAEAIVTR